MHKCHVEHRVKAKAAAKARAGIEREVRRINALREAARAEKADASHDPDKLRAATDAFKMPARS